MCMCVYTHVHVYAYTCIHTHMEVRERVHLDVCSSSGAVYLGVCMWLMCVDVEWP